MKSILVKAYTAIKAPLLVMLGAYLAFVGTDGTSELTLRLFCAFFVSWLVWVVANPLFVKKILKSAEEEKIIHPHVLVTEKAIVHLVVKRLAWEFFWYFWFYLILGSPLLVYLTK